jgi:hypothetical protein
VTHSGTSSESSVSTGLYSVVTSPEGNALIGEVRDAVATLEGLLVHGEQLGEPLVVNIRTTLAEAREKLDRQELFVVVVAETGAGKTTFLNALLGEHVLPEEVREPASVTYLRRGAEEGYVARLTNGKIEDFAELHPDEISEPKKRLEALELESRHSAGARETAAAELLEQRAAADHAQGELKHRFKSFESAREEAERLSREIAEAESHKLALRERAGEQERALPGVLRSAPPFWAVWLLVAFAVSWLFFRARFRAWHDTLAELDRARNKTARLQLAASEAALACRQAEVALEPAASPAASTQANWQAARVRLGDVDTQLARLSEDCDDLRAELGRRLEARRSRFLEDLRRLGNADLRGKELAEIEIVFPARHLPEDVTIIDAPGVTAADSGATERAWQLIREKADGCILVSELDRAVTGPTKAFLQRLRDVVPHVLLVLTKMDASFLDAMRRRAKEPWEEVEQARRIATRRFAREIGRDASSVLSIAVAAEAALEEAGTTGLGQRFEAEVTKLFRLLRQERALILGARAAAAVRRCIDSTGEAQGRAERFYEERISRLEEQKRPEPEHFRSEQLDLAQPRILEAAAEITSSALEVLRNGMNGVRAQTRDVVMAAPNKRELVALAAKLEDGLGRGIQTVANQVARHVDLQADAAVRRIELAVFEALRLRYEIAHLVTRSSSPSLHLESARSAEASAPALAPRIEQAARRFRSFRAGLAAAGAVAGALAGTLVLPWIGTAIGAALGASLMFARTLGSLKKDCLHAVNTCLDEPEQGIARQLRASEAETAETIGRALDHSVARAMARFDLWILEPLEAERAAIEHEREKLRDLLLLRDRLFQHNEQLAVRMREATEASLGLCL